MRNKHKPRYETLTGTFFLLPNFIGFLIFILIPVIVSLILSFFQCDIFQMNNSINGQFVGLQNFTNILGFYKDGANLKANDPEFWQFLGNTLFLMGKIPITIFISLLLALLLNKPIKGLVFFRTAFFLPTICVGTAMYLLWRWLFNADFGLINFMIDKLTLGQIIGPKWLANPKLSKTSFILMNTWIEMGGINMLLYLAALKSIPNTYYEACEIDGANSFQKFINITWPMLAPATFFIVIINLINGFQEGFQQAHIMTNGGPAGSTTMLSYYIYNNAYVWNHMGYAAAVSWILFSVILLITSISWRFGGRSIHYH